MVAGLLFYIISALLLFCAIKVVTTTYVLRSAIYLLFTLLFVAAEYLLLNAEFVAVAQLLIYVGGTVVVTVFAVLLVSNVGEAAEPASGGRKTLAAISSLLLGAVVLSFIYSADLSGLTASVSTSGAEEIGRALLCTGSKCFVVPFELLSLLLLAALIGAIAIAKTKILDSEITTASSGGADV